MGGGGGLRSAKVICHVLDTSAFMVTHTHRQQGLLTLVWTHADSEASGNQRWPWVSPMCPLNYRAGFGEHTGYTIFINRGPGAPASTCQTR